MENDASQPLTEKVVLQIIIGAEGTMKVAGPMISDEVAAYGLLEKAKQMICELHKPKVLKPQGFLQGLRKNGVGH